MTIENVAAHCHRDGRRGGRPGCRTRRRRHRVRRQLVLPDAPARRDALGSTGARDLTRLTQSIQDALRAAGITGVNGADIDHIELSAAPYARRRRRRNFVLCSGGEYDRSPCGTGTSAVMAARHRRGQLALGEPWRQESVAGSLFTGWLTAGPNGTLDSARARHRVRDR